MLTGEQTLRRSRKRKSRVADKLSAAEEKLAWMYVHGPTAGNGVASAIAAWPDIPEEKVRRRGVPSNWKRSVRNRVAELQAEARQDYQIDGTSSVVRLLSLQARAAEAGDWKAAVRAEELIGRIAGLYIERRHTITQDLSREESEQRLAMLVDRYPGLLDVVSRGGTLGLSRSRPILVQEKTDEA
jgi:hypothetical protein